MSHSSHHSVRTVPMHRRLLRRDRAMRALWPGLLRAPRRYCEEQTAPHRRFGVPRLRCFWAKGAFYTQVPPS